MYAIPIQTHFQACGVFVGPAVGEIRIEKLNSSSAGATRKIGRYVFSHGITSVLVAGALGLAIVIGTWLARPSSQHLTLFESMLVQLGLAEVPEHQTIVQPKPNVKVWVDTHTALYYCQGAELYGKTPGGRFSTQGIALQERFDSANGSPCE